MYFSLILNNTVITKYPGKEEILVLLQQILSSTALL